MLLCFAGVFCVSPRRNQLGLEVDDSRVDKTSLTPQAFCSFRWVPSYQRGRGEASGQEWCGKALGDEQGSKGVCETPAETLMCKGRVSLGRNLCWSDGLVHIQEVAERSNGRAGKKGWWAGNGGRHEPDPSEQSCFGNCCDCEDMPVHLPMALLSGV